jgi:hypothetical protein
LAPENLTTLARFSVSSGAIRYDQLAETFTWWYDSDKAAKIERGG